MILSVVDAKPRNVESSKVSGLYPNALQDTSPISLISFIERYYEHINSIGLPSYEISNITSDKDIDIASDKYLTSIQSLIAKTIPKTSVLDKVTLYKIVIQYYNTRGSEDSIYAFFKIFYDEIVSIFYPKDYLFDLSSGSGSWGEIDFANIATCNTNPNKEYLIITSNTVIDPGGEYIVTLQNIGNNIWSYNGLDPTQTLIPYVEPYNNIYGGSYNETQSVQWIFTYGNLQNISINTSIYPDEAIWGPMVDAINYDSSIVIYDNDDNIDNVIYKYQFSIQAQSIDALYHGNTIYDTSTVKTIYSAIELNPTIWTILLDTNMWSYTNHKSFASDQYKLHDGYYWQKYSYEIKSGQSSNVWMDDYIKFVHPAGLQLFSALLLQLVAKSEWYAKIAYELSNFELGVNKYQPPILGYHTPTYQPGWLNNRSRTYNIIAMALRNANVDASLIQMILTDLKIIKESSNSRNSLIRSDYQTWSKNIDSTQLCAAYFNKTIEQAEEEYSNINICNFSNISAYITVTIRERDYFLSKTIPLNVNENIFDPNYSSAILGDLGITPPGSLWFNSAVNACSILSNLKVNIGTTGVSLIPIFSPGNDIYTATVETSDIIITPYTDDIAATITINSSPPIASGAPFTITLASGINHITIATQSQDLVTLEYKITITAP